MTRFLSLFGGWWVRAGSLVAVCVCVCGGVFGANARPRYSTFIVVWPADAMHFKQFPVSREMPPILYSIHSCHGQISIQVRTTLCCPEGKPGIII